MKKQFLNLISFTFCGVLVTTVNAGNDGELKSKVNNTYAPFHLVKSKGDEGNGIKGKTMISADIGFNTLRLGLLIRYITANDNNNGPYITSSKQIPLVNFGVDYGFGKKFSLGVAYAFQTVTLTSSKAQGYGFSNGVVSVDVVDTWKRQQFAVRGDYYIIAKENLSLYTGLKLGYNIYTVTSSITPFYPAYPTDIHNTVIPSAVAVQAHFGFSYYFSELIGVNTEAALGYGGPYFLAAGLTLKL